MIRVILACALAILLLAVTVLAFYKSVLIYQHEQVVQEPTAPKVNEVRIWTREQLLERCTGKGLRYEACGSGEWQWCDGTKKIACQMVEIK